MRILNFLLCCILILAACKSNNAEKEESELPSLAYTIYSQHTELFAEFKTPVVGDTLMLAGHFTYMQEVFTAINSGTITLTLIVGDKNVSQTSSVSSSPGIFRYAIVPAEAGIGRMIFEIKNEGYTDKVIIDSVFVYADKKAALASAKEETHNASEISYLKEQAWKVEFANMEVVSKPFSEVIKTTGEILPAQGDEMVVTATTSGIVTFSGNKSIAGASVNTGEMLFSISGGSVTDGNAETQFKKAKTAYDKAKADYDRLQELVKDNIVSQKDFLEAKARFETEQAIFNNLARNYLAGGQRITSPISGFVKDIAVSEGQHVTPGQTLATVSQNKRLMLKAEVSQKYFAQLPSIVTANFKTLYDNKTYSIDELNGRLLSFGKSNDASTLLIPVTFSFDNKGAILPGSLVDVYLKLKPNANALSIPLSALIEEQGVFYTYVQTAGESFEKRELRLGGSDGFNIRVLSGIKQGERVVTKGAYQIKLATATGTIPAHGHAH